MQNKNRPAQLYITAFGLIGGLLLVWAIWQLSFGINWPLFLGLMILGNVVHGFTAVNKKIDSAYSINHGTHLATLAVAGLPTAIVLGTVSTIFTWLANKLLGRDGWKGTFSQLIFNTGMMALLLTILYAAYTQLSLLNIVPDGTIAVRIAFWLIVAVAIDQINLILVSGIVYLTNGTKPIAFWQQHKWLMPMNIVIAAVIGGLLYISLERMGLSGLIVFCVPMLLTSCSIYLYARQIERHVNELELRGQELEHSNGELEQLNKAKDRFLAVLSHDMRTTLTSIRLYGQMLNTKSSKLTDAKREKMLSAILESERTLTRLVDNLIEIEQIEDNGMSQPINAPIDLAEEVQQIVSALEIQLITKNLNLYTKFHQEPLTINADAMMIQKIIRNLVSNAINYTPPHGAIHLNLYSNDSDVVLIVEDTGYGIPKDALETIFDPYYRVPEHVDRALGTGLGLSIVKTMVELHGGRIDVASEEGLGSRFTVRLPKNLDTAADEALNALSEQATNNDVEQAFRRQFEVEGFVSAETPHPVPELP